jgi:hypothetical protein
MKKLILALTSCFCLSCVANVHADNVREAQGLLRRCKEISARCNRATTTARTVQEYEEAIEICQSSLCYMSRFD